MKRVAITTIDNPHNPIDDFPAWFQLDTASGYNTLSLLSRIVVDSDSLSDSDAQLELERAIDEICRENVSGVFVKVEKIVADS